MSLPPARLPPAATLNSQSLLSKVDPPTHMRHTPSRTDGRAAHLLYHYVDRRSGHTHVLTHDIDTHK